MTALPLALVSGGSRGIGAAVCRELSAAGFEVWIGCHRSRERAEALCDELRAADRLARVLPLDVADAEGCQAQLEQQLAGRAVRAVVHCAGIVDYQLLARARAGFWEEMLRVNLGGFFNATRPLVKGMVRERQGSIVAVGSIAGRTGLEGASAYAAAKSGLLGAVRSLARELGSFGIRANLVAPGFIQTDMTQGVRTDELVPRIPLRRIGQPEEVARVIAFLCSEGASYVTGAALDVSGGLDM